MKKLYFLLFLISCLTACQQDDSIIVVPDDQSTTDAAHSEPLVIDFDNVFKYSYGNNQDIRGYYVFNDAVSWQSFTANINSPLSYNVETGTTVNDLRAIDIDFATYTVLAVVDDLYHYGGHDININSIVQNGGSLEVAIEKTYPGPGTLAAVLTQPYHIVKIPKTQLPVVFLEQ